MIYRIKINGSPPASPSTSLDVATGQVDRWFVTQIDSRFGQVIDEPMPRDWADLVVRASRIADNKN